MQGIDKFMMLQVGVSNRSQKEFALHCRMPRSLFL